jgi:hypothetical protein
LRSFDIGLSQMSCRNSTLEKCTAFCTAELPIPAILVLLENPIRLALKFTALVFSSICGKIDSIGEVAGFSGDVRVLPEEPMILLDLPARITPDDPQNYNTVGTFVGTLTLPLQNAA